MHFYHFSMQFCDSISQLTPSLEAHQFQPDFFRVGDLVSKQTGWCVGGKKNIKVNYQSLGQ